MKRIIVDYAKLTNEILTLLVEKFPDGYDDTDIIQFTNAKGELIEAVEVRTTDTIYLVKVSTKLQDRIENYDEDEEDITSVDSINVKDLDMDEDQEDDKPKKSSKKKKVTKSDDEEDSEEEDDDDDSDYDDEDEDDDSDYDDEDEDDEDDDR
ncbi:DNA primase [Flavobacterium sp. xlx-214]|uniref:DNA primase n=1 Tax=unclassified Flavobacterium TaxID=196869 RepID=UPI0013D7CE15|nr:MULTISPECIES: DNA primase [unclassified Flavobacterium]MBA5793131.1 DNA primase [Flavobacterium sp. xlx-221]QMI82582.1 DNA primase [Flavobacterium sp. xlx-214]